MMIDIINYRVLSMWTWAAWKGYISLLLILSWDCSQGDLVQHEGHWAWHREFQPLFSSEPPAINSTQRITTNYSQSQIP